MYSAEHISHKDLWESFVENGYMGEPAREYYRVLDDQIEERCKALGAPKLYGGVVGALNLASNEYDLRNKWQLALIGNPHAVKSRRFDVSTKTLEPERFRHTTRSDHSLLVACLALEIIANSQKAGSALTETEITAVALAAALHDMLHANGSHAGERALARIVQTANRVDWSLGEQFMVSPDYEKIMALGHTLEERAKWMSHETRLTDLLSRDALMRGMLSGDGLKIGDMPLLMEVLEEKGLGQILSLADTLAYLTHDYIEVRGRIFRFQNGKSILRNILPAIWFNKDAGHMDAMPGLPFEEVAGWVKELLELRAVMRREYYHHPDTALNEAMKERAIWLAYWTTPLTLADITKGGDNHLFKKIVEVIEGMDESFTGDNRGVKIARTLKALAPAFTDNAIPPVYIPIPQDDLLKGAGSGGPVFNRHGNLIGVKIGQKEYGVVSRLEGIAMKAVDDAFSPGALGMSPRDSNTAAGGLVVVGPTAHADKGFNLGGREIVADEPTGDVVFGIKANDFIIGLTDTDPRFIEGICQYIYSGVCRDLFLA